MLKFLNVFRLSSNLMDKDCNFCLSGVRVRDSYFCRECEKRYIDKNCVQKYKGKCEECGDTMDPGDNSPVCSDLCSTRQACRLFGAGQKKKVRENICRACSFRPVLDRVPLCSLCVIEIYGLKYFIEKM